MGLSIVSTETKWLIIAYHKLKFTKSKISGLCNVLRASVTTEIKNWKESGSTYDKPRSGRTRCTTPREDKRLMKLSRQNPE